MINFLVYFFYLSAAADQVNRSWHA